MNGYHMAVGVMTMPKESTGPLDLVTHKMVTDDIEFAYKLYCQNNCFIDENIGDFPILGMQHYTEYDFNTLISDDDVVTLMLVNKKLVKQHPYKPFYIDDKCGFLSCEKRKLDRYVQILFLETIDKRPEYYSKLIQDVVEIAKASKNYDRIQIEIEDGNDKLMQIIMKEGFYETNVLTPKSGRDIYIFSKSLRKTGNSNESDNILA